MKTDNQAFRQEALSIGKIVLGCFLYSLSVVWFIDPAQIIPGSVTGIGVVVKALTGFPIGMLNLIINIPLVIVGTIILGKRLLIYTGLTVLLNSLMMDGFAFVQPFTEDVLLASIFGGVIMGVGLGLILDGGGSTGGTTVVGKIISRYHPEIPIGNILMAGDFIIIMVGSFFLKDWDLLLYSLIDLYVCVVVMNIVIYGYKTQSLTIVACDKGLELAEQLKSEGLCRIVSADAGQVIVVSRKKNVNKIQKLATEADAKMSVTSYNADFSL